MPVGGPLSYPTNSWQELNWYPAYSWNDFFDFCSNVTNINAPANITAVDSALVKYSNGDPWTNLGNYANYIKQAILPLCSSADYDSPECFGTQNGLSRDHLRSFTDGVSFCLVRYFEQRRSVIFIYKWVFLVSISKAPLTRDSLHRAWSLPSRSVVLSILDYERLAGQLYVSILTAQS